MSKKESNINFQNTKIDYNIEEVPYLNNESDYLQDQLKELEKHTFSIENQILSTNLKTKNNVIELNFDRNKKNS